jgi:nucleotide-binding universal stress UspA family protein
MKKQTRRIRKIIVPLDFSSSSESTIDYATMIAERFAATLILVHVIESLPYSVTDTFQVVEHRRALETLARSLLRNLSDDLRARNLDVKTHLVWGNPAREILAKARREKADLIVMGTHGRTGLPHMVMGSVAEKTVRLSRIPVLTVPLAFKPRRRRLLRAKRSEKRAIKQMRK